MRKQSQAGTRRNFKKLLIQPEEGLEAILDGISGARKSVEIAIFRFDQKKIEQALEKAVGRGVAVSALIASVNRAGERGLRALELRLLGAGVKVARTDTDLLRYHGKYMIVDQRRLYLLAFNWTHADIERSRSFGLIASNTAAVREAIRLFDADSRRIPMEPPPELLVVSPLNARRQIATFIKQAKKELVVYDPKVGDPEMIKLLASRAKAGVRIRILGKLEEPIPGVEAYRLAHLRLHTRTMVRDGTHGFLGSQSLRTPELDQRREVGTTFHDLAAVAGVLRTFESDWEKAVHASRIAADTPTVKIAKKLAKVVVREMPAVTPIVNGAVKQNEIPDPEIVAQEVAEIVRHAVQEALQDAEETAVQKVGGNA
ncbi:MAG: phospholipase D-like domain-containing protein [Candidatus Solibacter sp.]